MWPSLRMATAQAAPLRRLSLQVGRVGGPGAQIVERLLGAFPPETPFAMGYGSGVVKQENHVATKNTMIDLVFAVKDAEKWHEENLRLNREHYSALGMLGAGLVARLQREWGARMYYNTLVECNGQLIKYGVITEDDLVADLQTWDTLYMAGRLHKPVTTARTTDRVEEARDANLEHAVRVALLLLPGTFSETQLYEAIAGVSYLGDPRMLVGEDSNKVRNIVRGSLEGFRWLYAPVMPRFSHLVGEVAVTSPPGAEVAFEQDTAPESRALLVKDLPESISRRVAEGPGGETEAEAVRRAVAAVVQSSSTSQSLKGLLTAGVRKSAVYAAEKVQKKLKSDGHHSSS